MAMRTFTNRTLESEAFDMTPVIDVVFLLIIFFMLVCQLMVAERFKVEVPEQIAAAAPQAAERAPVLTAMPDDDGGVRYAVGSERLNVANPADLSRLVAAAIDDHYRDAPTDAKKIVRLRCDKTIPFGRVRPLLEAIAQSAATDVDWAVRQ